MATFTIRATEEQDKALEAFMSENDFSTKSKAVLWLIENSSKLRESRERLNAIKVSHERMAQEKELIALLLSQA